MKKTILFLLLSAIFLTGCGQKPIHPNVTVYRQQEILLELKGEQSPTEVQAFSDLTNGGTAVMDVPLDPDSPDYLLSFSTEQEGKTARFNLYFKGEQLYFTPSFSSDPVVYRSELTSKDFEKLLQKQAR